MKYLCNHRNHDTDQKRWIGESATFVSFSRILLSYDDKDTLNWIIDYFDLYYTRRLSQASLTIVLILSNSWQLIMKILAILSSYDDLSHEEVLCKLCIYEYKVTHSVARWKFNHCCNTFSQSIILWILFIYSNHWLLISWDEIQMRS